MTVLVTGGSGVVGGAVIRHLVDSGETVRALSRSSDSDEKIKALGALPVRGDMIDPASLPEAFEGIDLVYHIAGVNEMCSKDPAKMVRTNVEGSLAVLRAAGASKVGRVVYTSSAAAIGEEHGTIGTESSPHRGSYLSHYERSKHLAEQAMISEPTNVELVVVNPSSVQGPGRSSGTGKLILDVARGKLPVLVDTRLSIVDIDDCARGHLLAAERGKPRESYILNSFTLPIRDAIEMLEGRLGRDIKVRYLPGWVAQGASMVIEGAWRSVGRKPPLCREMIRTVRNGHAYDGSRATRELGLEYTPAEEILARLIDWFRNEGMLE